MAQLKANYETVMVFSVKNGEESVNALVEKFNTLIADNATINKVDTWGQRTLAYPEFPAELDRIYKITDGVLRSLIVAKEEATQAEEA